MIRLGSAERFVGDPYKVNSLILSAFLRMSYRISTNFNWYARPVMRFLLGDLAERNVEYYRQRSEDALK